jgi:uncharacterized membrane protein (DUF4010 family)
MDIATLFQKFALALGLGLLIGIQRERSSSALAGFRTFPLVTMLGTLCGLLSIAHGWPVIAAGLIALVALVVISNVAKLRAGQIDPGMTTEVAILMMFALGAYLVTGPAAVAVVLGATVTLLLHFKPELHGLAKRIGERDFHAIMLFVAIALVILPILPDATFGPYQVLNPRRIWWMVVLITGISLGGYLIYKAFDQTTGAVAGGILGGLISSTATTVSYARRTKEQAGSEGPAALVIVLAGAVVFARVLVTVAVAAPAHFPGIAPSVSIMLVLMAVLAFCLWWRTRGDKSKLPEQANPTELKSAIVFAALFAVVLLAVAAAKDLFGNRGLYPVAILSGLTDMDAITLSSAEMARDGRVDTPTAARLIIMASLANMVFKAGMVAALGSRALFLRIAIVFSGALIGGGLLLWWM